MTIALRCVRAFAVASVLVFAGVAHADEPVGSPPSASEPAVQSGGAQLPPSPATATPAEVRVTGQNPTRELRESPFTVTVVDTNRVAGRATTTDEVLNRTAGLKVRSGGGVGSDMRLSLRGLEGRRVAIYVNGVPVSTQDGSFSFANLPLPLIERIEVYKGVVPAAFGGDGLGSAINIVTKERHAGYTDLGYGYGSFDTHRVFGTTRWMSSDERLVVDLSTVGNVAKNDYQMPGPRPGTVVTRNHDRFAQVVGGVGIEMRRIWFDSVRLDVSLGSSLKQLQGLPGSALLRNDVREARFRAASQVGRLTLVKRELAPKLDATYQLSVPVLRTNFADLGQARYDFDGNRLSNQNGRGEAGFGPNDSRNSRIEVQSRTDLNYAISERQALHLNHYLVRVFDRPSDDFANRAAGVMVSGTPGDLLTSTTALSHQASLFGDRLATVLGVKHHYFQASGRIASLFEIINNAAVPITEQYKHAFGASAGARYRIFPGLSAKASVERAVRLPSSIEVFGDNVAVTGTANLAPETAHNVDVGLVLDKRLGERRVFADLSLFYSEVDQLITLIGSYTPQYANIGAARIAGVEADVRADLTSFLYAYANVTFQDAVDVTEFLPGTNQPSYLNGLRLPNLPYLFGNAGLEVRVRTPGLSRALTRLYYDFSTVAGYFFDYEVSVNQERRIPGYSLHGAGIQQSFEDARYTAALELSNLADTQYQDQFARPLPGRAFRIFLRATFL